MWIFPDGSKVRLTDSRVTLQCKNRVVSVGPGGVIISNDKILSEEHPSNKINTSVTTKPNESAVTTTVQDNNVNELVVSPRGNILSDTNTQPA